MMYTVHKCTSTEDNQCCEPKAKTIYKEFCNSDQLFLEKCKSSIKEVEEIAELKDIYINAVIKEFKVIESCGETKVFFHGIKFIKVRYVSYNFCSPIVESYFITPFCECITIHHCKEINVCNVDAKVLCCGTTKCSSKEIFISTLISVRIKFFEKCDDELETCQEQWQCFNDKSNELTCKNKFQNDELDCHFT